MNKIIIHLFCVLTAFVAVSCNNEPLIDEKADQKAKETFASANTANGIGIQYFDYDPASRGLKVRSVESAPQSRSFNGPGYYVVFQDGSIEPFGIRDTKGKLQNIEIYGIQGYGSVLLINPDWEDCCEAVGRGHGKTEEEANYLFRLFRQFVVDTKTGKVYTLPTDNDIMFQPGMTTMDADGNLYTCSGSVIWMLDIHNFTVNTIPTSVYGRVACLNGGVLLAGSEGSYEFVFPDRQHKVVQEGKMILFDDILIGYTAGTLSTYKIKGNDVNRTILGENFCAEFIYNPMEKAVICANFGDDKTVYYQYDGKELKQIDFPDELWEFATGHTDGFTLIGDSRDNKLFRLEKSPEMGVKVSVLDFSTLTHRSQLYSELANHNWDMFRFCSEGDVLYELGGMNLNGGAYDRYAIKCDFSLVKLSSTDQYTSSPLIPFN